MPIFHKDPMQALGDVNYQHMLILNKDPMQTMIIFSQSETKLALDKHKKLPEENVQVTVEENTNSLIPKCILM